MLSNINLLILLLLIDCLLVINFFPLLSSNIIDLYSSAIRADQHHEEKQKDAYSEPQIPESDQNSISPSIAKENDKDIKKEERKGKDLYLCSTSELRSHSIWATEGIWEAALDQGM